MPSKKVIYTFVACLIALGGIGFSINYKPSPKKIISNSNNLIAANTVGIEQNLLDKDSDNDGLKDWEETLWKTDPHNPDTDGDGTPDGQEVKEGRNPSVKGPNDKLDKNQIPSGF